MVDVIVMQRDELAVGGCAETHALLSARAVSDGVEHHLASEH